MKVRYSGATRARSLCFIKNLLRCGGLPGRKAGVFAHAELHQRRLTLPTAARATEVDVICNDFAVTRPFLLERSLAPKGLHDVKVLVRIHVVTSGRVHVVTSGRVASGLSVAVQGRSN